MHVLTLFLFVFFFPAEHEDYIKIKCKLESIFLMNDFIFKKSICECVFFFLFLISFFRESTFSNLFGMFWDDAGCDTGKVCNQEW